MQRAPFGVRLAEATATLGPLCVGIDPHPELLRAWGLPVDPDGLRRFARTCVEAFAGHVAVVKPQSAFFEEYGSAGIQVLEETLAAFRGSGTLTLLDVKRGDIGSTMAGYGRAYLADGSPLAADAITVSPYLGFGSLAPAIALAGQTGRGVFVLALTSNPEGAEVQHARDGQVSVAGAVVAGAREANAAALSEGHLGHVGLVVGATIGSAAMDLGIDLATVNGPLLAPGFGAQGADAAAIRRLFGAVLPAVLPSSSREILGAGPDLGDLRAAAYGAWPGE
ncbi:MAG: orotidine-5'-phosphate decarboxylase [Tetrasphaera jenkinsii]|nr:orotidine-5'-phosphate decarboxylase [Tetrasphaera jenkinsii]